MRVNNSNHLIISMIIGCKKQIFLLFPCIVIVSIGTFLQPLIIRIIMDKGMTSLNISTIVSASVILFFVYILVRFASILQTKLFVNMHKQIYNKLMTRSLEKVLKLPISYFNKRSSAEIGNIMITDAENIASLADDVFSYSVSGLLQIISGILGLAIVDWRISVIIISSIPIKCLIINIFSRLRKIYMQKYIETDKEFYSWINELLDGIKELKLWNLYDQKNIDFEKIQSNLMKNYQNNAMLDQWKLFAESALDMLLNCILYIICGYMVVKGEMTIGTTLAAISYNGYVTMPISLLISLKYMLAKVKPSIDRFISFMAEQEEYVLCVKGENKEKIQNNNSNAIVFQNVSFSYENSKQILDNVSLEIKHGERVLIRGENGAGKSTVINLLVGFNYPDKGKILIYGRTLDVLGIQELRNQFSVVLQKPYLFKGTVKENVDLGGHHNIYEIKKACKLSGASTFIEQFPLSYEEPIEKDAINLSGGERQKLAVARAFLKGSPILLFDEAEVGYDMESNEKLFSTLISSRIDKTIVIITHQQMALDNFDKVYELRDGHLNII